MANYINQDKKKLLQNQESKETPVSGGYQQGADGKQADALLQQINNREKFSYDMEKDPLYQQYKKQAIQYGQRAMQDTMGQAAALTGGYGSSYSQSAGQQAYQNYLQKLNEQVPQLYQLALNQYNQQGQDLKDQYALYADREAQNYSRYLDSLAQQQWNQQFAYQQDRDAVADQQWQQQFDTQNQQWQQQFDADQAYQQWQQQFSQQQFDTQNQQWQKEFDLASSKSSGGGSDGVSNNGPTINYKNMGYGSYNEMTADLQKIAKSQGNDALFNKLREYNARGYLDDETANDLYLSYKQKESTVNSVPASVMDPEDWKRRTGTYKGYKEYVTQSTK